MISIRNTHRLSVLMAILLPRVAIAESSADSTSVFQTGSATLVLCFVTGFALVMWRNQRRVSRINRELRETNEQLEAAIESSKRNQDLREALERRVARAERLESLGSLAGAISHDFNNLLVGVVCNAQLLKRPELAEDARDRCIDGILKSADKATDLSKKMRTYAGCEPTSRQPIEIVSLLKTISPLLESKFNHATKVQFDFKVNEAWAHADQAQVDKILMSLSSNVVDSINPDQGRVTFRVGKEHVENVVDDTDLVGERSSGGDFVFIEVEDNGQGIPANEIGKIFEPFFSTKDSGRGMGLAVVYGLVNRQDGLIRCVSHPGIRTTMRVLLPQSEAQKPSPPREVETKTKRLNTGNIVIVDDKQDILDVVSRSFSTYNWSAHCFRSGIRAIEFIQQQSQSIDCIVLDVVMPELSGEQVVQQLHELGIRIPIVMMSGFSNTNLNDFTTLPNVAATLNKPFSIAELVDSINRVTAPANSAAST